MCVCVCERERECVFLALNPHYKEGGRKLPGPRMERQLAVFQKQPCCLHRRRYLDGGRSIGQLVLRLRAAPTLGCVGGGGHSGISHSVPCLRKDSTPGHHARVPSPFPLGGLALWSRGKYVRGSRVFLFVCIPLLAARPAGVSLGGDHREWLPLPRTELIPGLAPKGLERPTGCRKGFQTACPECASCSLSA